MLVRVRMATACLNDLFPQVDVAIEEGRMLDAWELAVKTGVALEDWPAGEPLCQAARLASSLGAGQLSRVLHWRNWRDRRDDPRRYVRALHSRIYHASAIKLLWETQAFLEKGKDIPVPELADLLAFQASVHVMLADFERAGRLLDEAISLDPASSWLRAERSAYFSAADRYEEALEEARTAVSLSPCYRAAVSRCSEALIHLGKDDEALELLEQAHANSQQAAFPIAMQVIHSERGDFERGLWCLSEVERLSPLIEPSLKNWVASRRADFHLMAGNLNEFLEIADTEMSPFKKKIAENLRRDEAAQGVRKRLDVRFTRQHRMTCAPATLASIAAYWGVERDHLEIAETICYEGTPWHKERGWAENNGFVTKEFRLTRGNLVTLIDRGLPFTLTTEWTTGAHLQACIGYDTRTDTVILRDPTERHYGERLLGSLMASHPLGGPRAMLMVPVDREEILSGLLLEDEHVYDSFHRMLVALETHDRFRIQTAVSELRAVAPDHPLALDGEMRAANALQDWPRALVLVKILLKRFPDHEPLWLTKCGLLVNLRRMRDHREFLEGVVARGGADPVFQSDLGELLAEDARELTMADYHLRRALKHRGHEARVYENLARCRMKHRRFSEAASLRRAASCLAPAFEPYAANYFETCRIIGKTSEALEHLERRASRLGAKDHGPWLTHARMLEAIDRPAEAAAVLEKAEASHPDDGNLLLRGGHLMISWGPEFRQKGMDWMARSRGRVRDTLWLRESAEAAAFTGDRVTAIRHWQSLMALQPLDISVWRSLAWLVAEEKGRKEAIRLLDEGTAKFPDFADLWGLAAEWLAADPRGAIPALDRYLQLMPASAWGYRERALRRAERNEHEAALADTREALELEPESSVSLHIHGRILAKMQRRAEAAAALRQALSMDIDRSEAATELMNLAADREESIKLIGFIEDEMRRQVSNGAIVPTFQRLSWRWMDPEELLEKLRGFCDERPDLWQTWSACITQALRMSLHDKAREAAETMTATFPLMPRAWMDLAMVHQATGDIGQEMLATGKALEISPAWDEAARLHADALERAGQPKAAETILRKAVSTDPLNPTNRGCLADLLRRMARNDEAVDVLMAALRGSPFYQWGWSQLAVWVKKDNRQDEAIALLESVSEAQAHRHAWWSQAADAWMDLERPANAIRATRQGLAGSPEDGELREKLAWLLCESGEVDEALALCEPRPGEQRVSREIGGRRAWILMRSGQPVRAIQAMRELLDLEPDYVWGLGELTGWLAKRGEWQGALEIATRWARHAPLDRTALGFVGQAEENLGHPEAAAKAYAKALVLQPDYEFAGRRLLDIQMKAKGYAEAAGTLAHLRHYTPSIWLECDAVELELLRRNFDEALVLAGSILGRTDAHFDVVHWLDNLFTQAQRDISWRNLLEGRLNAGTAVAPGALAVSIGNIGADVFTKVAYKRIKAQPLGSPVRVEGWKRMLELAAKLKETAAILKWVSKDRLELHAEATLWNEVGGAFLTVGEYARGVAWMQDWPQRNAGVTTDTLTWVAALNDGCRKNNARCKQAAKEARAEALRRFPTSGIGSVFRAGLAFQAAVDGNIAEAKAVLSDFEPTTVSNYYANYGKLAQAVIAAADGDENLAKTYLSEAISFFAEVHEMSAKILGEEAMQAVAVLVPSARGSMRRLRRQWKLPALGKVTKAAKAGTGGLPKIGGWGLFTLVFVVAQLLRACASI